MTQAVSADEELDLPEDEAESAEDQTEAEEAEDEGAEGEDGSDDQPEPEATEGESPPLESENKAPDWVRELRKTNREKDRRLRELEAELKAARPQQDAPGQKPKLEDHDYDAEAYAAALESWLARKHQAESKEVEKAKAEETAKAAWDVKVKSYSKAKAALNLDDYDDAEDTVKDFLSTTQQGILMSAKQSARLVYELGTHPDKALQLASIKDPVEFTFAVAELAQEIVTMKTAPRKAPPPERVTRGRVGGSVDSALAKLREEADRTGDRTKVANYIRQQKARET